MCVCGGGGVYVCVCVYWLFVVMMTVFHACVKLVAALCLACTSVTSPVLVYVALSYHNLCAFADEVLYYCKRTG